MSHTSKEEYLESCRQRYPSRNRAGKSAMIDEASDALGCGDLPVRHGMVRDFHDQILQGDIAHTTAIGVVAATVLNQVLKNLLDPLRMRNLGDPWWPHLTFPQ